MMLKSLRLKNIRSYLDEKIDFPAGTSLLSGDIGSGKSTILMAMDFTLFGLRKGELSGSDLLRHGKDEGSVELELTVDNKDVRIKRSLKRGNSISQETCRLTINGLAESVTPLELKARILEMLGYPQELVKKNKPIFRYTVYTPQEEMKAILRDEENRLEILRKIFGIDKYGLIRSNARLFLTELRAMKRELDAYSRDLEIRLQEKKEAEKTLAAIKKQAGGVKAALTSVNSRYEEKRSRAEKMKAELEDHRKMQIAIARKESEILSLKKRLSDTDLELSNIDSKIQFNINLVSETVEGNINDLTNAIRMLEKDRDGMLKNAAVIDAELDKMSSIFAKGVCSFCNQPVSDPASYKQHIDERLEKRQQVLAGIKDVDGRLDTLKKQVAALERYSTIKRTVDDLKLWKKTKEDEAERIKVDLEGAEKYVISLKTESDKRAGLEEQYGALESELTALQKDKLELEKSLSRFEQQAEDLEERLGLLEKEISEKESARKKSERITALLSWFDLFIALMENIEKHVLLTVQKEFDQYFQYWFSILMGDALSVRIDEGFSPVIEQNSYETSFDNLSGGEKTAISLAYRLALNKVINIMIDSIRTKDLLILDEPTDGFSTDQLDRVRDVINALGLKQIIIVSHEPKIDTYVENVIKIYKENHVSRVVQ